MKIVYLEHAYGTKYFVVDQVNGHINAIHDDSIELTEFTGHFSPFNLEEMELKVCKLADHHKGANDPTQDISAPNKTNFVHSLTQMQAPDSRT